MQLAGVTVGQFVKTGVLAVLFIIFAKIVAEKSGIAGFQTLMRGV